MEPNDPESPADASSSGEGTYAAQPGDLRVLESDWRALEWMIEHVEADSPVFLDTQTGELVEPVRPQALPPLGDGRHLRIEPLRPSEETAWMQEFVGQLADDWPRDALIEALLLSEAPRRAFAEALGRYPAERVLWLACRRQRLRERVRSWLAGHGLAIRGDQDEA